MTNKRSKEEINYYSIKGAATFKGFIKNGLDSSTMINLIVAFDANFEEFKKRGFSFPPNLLYYHEISRPEVIGVLINGFKFSKKEAIVAFNKLISRFQLNKIRRNDDKDRYFETLVEKTNNDIINKTGNKNLKIGEADIFIIAGFLSDNINVIHSGDTGFLETCKGLNLNIIPLPKRDREKEEEIKKWMKKRS